MEPINIQIITGESGTIVIEMKYTAFGEIRRNTGTNPLDYQSTGQRYKVEFGVSYYGAHGLDSSTAHFIQANAIIPQPGNAGDWDRYAYMLWNPKNYTNPSGHYSLLHNTSIPQIEGDDDITRNANNATRQEANKRVKMGPKNALVRSTITFTYNPVPKNFSLPIMAADPAADTGGYPYWAFGCQNYPYRDIVGMNLWNKQNMGHSGVDIAADDGTAVIWPFHETGHYYEADYQQPYYPTDISDQLYEGSYGGPNGGCPWP